MTLAPHIALIVLLAALAHASWNTIVKASGERNPTFAVMILTGGVLSLPAVAVLPPPAPEAWLYLGLSAAVHYGYYGFLLLAYRYGDLSHVYPLARGSAPLTVALGAWLFAGEALSPPGIAGLVLASAGLMSLAFENGFPRGHAGKPVFFALGTGLLIAVYTVLDGLGARAAGSAVSYIFWLNLFEAIPLALVLIALRPGNFLLRMRGAVRQGATGGALALIAYGLVIYALTLGGMAHVSALRETSTLFAALLGVVLLREARSRPGRRIAAALLVAGGVAALQLA